MIDDPRLGRPLLPPADARHVDGRVRVARDAHDRQRRADVRASPARAGAARCPAGVERIAAPTDVGWIIGRMQANGPADVAACHAFQDGLNAVPLSRVGQGLHRRPRPSTRTRHAARRRADRRGSGRRVLRALRRARRRRTRRTPNDYPILQRMARIGLVPGPALRPRAATPEVQPRFKARHGGRVAALRGLQARRDPRERLAHALRPPIGTYGTDYLRRQVSRTAASAPNVLEDAFYPRRSPTRKASRSRARKRYLMHFPPTSCRR